MGNYTTLLTDIPAFLENDSAEFLQNLPTIVTNAQDMMLRDLMIAELFGTASGTLTQSSISVPRPNDILTLRGFTILTASGINSLNYRDRSYMEQFWPQQSQTAVPIYYGVLDENTFMTAPTPDSPYFYTIQYKKRLAYLSSTNSSNYLSANCYDTLLAACLADAARFVMDDRQAGLIAVYTARYKEGVAAINGQQRRLLVDDTNNAGG
jgi:hypothetical protein